MTPPDSAKYHRLRKKHGISVANRYWAKAKQKDVMEGLDRDFGKEDKPVIERGQSASHYGGAFISPRKDTKEEVLMKGLSKAIKKGEL